MAIEKNHVYKLVGSTLSKIDGDSGIIAHSNNTNIVYFYADLATTYSIYMRFQSEKYYDLENVEVPPLKLMTACDTEIDDVIPNTYASDGYHLWKYSLPNSLTGINNSGRNLGIKLSFQTRELESPDEFLDTITTDNTTESAINAELKTLYTTAEASDFVNVYVNSTNAFTSYEFDGTDWVDQESILNQVISDETEQIADYIKPNSASTSEVTNRDITDDIVSEIAELNTTVAGITTTQAGLLDKATYDTDDNGIVDKAESVDDGAGNSSTAAEVATVISRVDQDLKTTASPEFAGITVDDMVIEEDNEEIDVMKTTFNSGETLLNGEQLQYTFKNDSGAIIYKGTPVYISGADGTNILVKPAINTNHDIAIRTIGLMKNDCAINGNCKVILFGKLKSVDTTGALASPTETWSAGDEIYLNGTSGTLTNTRPTGSTSVIFIGVVQRVSATVGEITIQLRHLPRITELSGVYPAWADLTDGDFLVYDAANSYIGVDNVNNYKFIKTGWPINATSLINVSFTDATRTVTLSKVSANVDYYIQNVKYTLSTDKTVVIDDTEGLWYIYLVGETLTASQTAWDFLDADKCMVATVYWDATNNECVTCSFEGHSYEMSPATHYNNHFAIGTYIVSGLVASDNGSDGLDVTAGYLADEDIVCQVVDNDTPTSDFEQPLTPLKAHKYYRTGASGYIRKVDDSTTPVYLVSNLIQLNPYSGGTYSLVNMTLNKFGAYWVVHTTDFNEPVKIFLGQSESDSLNNAIEDNGILSMNFGQIPLPEIKVAYRVIVKQLAISPYYSIEQVDSFVVDPSLGTPSDPATSHGALSGLADDDHTQYYNSTRLATYKTTTLDPLFDAKVNKDLSAETPIAYGSVPDDDTAFIPVDINGAFYKINLTNIYTGANVFAGSFSPDGDFSSDALIANATINGKIVALTGSTGQYKANIRDIADTYHVVIEMPDTSSDSTLTTQISFDDGTTYRYLQINGEDIPSASLSEKILHIYRDGTVLKIYSTNSDLSHQITHTDNIESTYGVISPIEGTPQLDEIKGLSVEQVLTDGDDFATGWTLGTGITVSGGDLVFTSVADTVTAYQDALPAIGTVVNVIYTISAYTGGGLRVNAGSGGVGTTRTAVGTYSENLTVTTDTTFSIESVGTTTATVSIVKVTPITNTPLSSLSASEINAKLPTYFEGRQDLSSISITSVGSNLVDKNNIVVEDSTNYTVENVAINGVEYWKYSSILNDGSNDFNISFKPNTQYTFKLSAYEEIDADNHRIRIAYTDGIVDDIYLATETEATYTFTSSSGKSIDFLTIRRTGNAGSSYIRKDDFQINEGTTALDYKAYNSGTQTFDTTLRSINASIYDSLLPFLANYIKRARVGVETGVSIGATINTTTLPLIDTSGVFRAYDETTGESQYGSYGDTLTLTNTATVYYQLATYVDSEVESNGYLIQDEITTIIQNQTIAGDLTLTYVLNKDKQVGVNVDRLNYLQDEIDDNETAIAQNASDIDDIETKTDLMTITNAINLNNVDERVALLTSAVSVSTATTKPASNITISDSIANYKYLIIEVDDGTGRRTPYEINGNSTAEQFIAVPSAIGSTLDWIGFKFYFDSTTTMTAYYGATYSPSYASNSNIDVYRIYGIK